jgi:sialic acid synthase SpsE
MKIGGWDSDDSVLIVAEVGNNHEGRFALAEELVGRAAEAGADAVKFQTFRPEWYVGPEESERLARLHRFRLSIDEFGQLSETARRSGLLFISTPFDVESARQLVGIVDALKVASGDITFMPLLDAIADAGRPVILSTGASDLDTTRYAFARLRSGSPPSPVAVLHCVSSYPTPLGEANLSAIRTLAAALPTVIGYSDHTIGSDAAVIAVACGARIIEKHFTVDHELSSFRDHQLSAEPKELAELVRRVRLSEGALGDGHKRVMDCERDSVVGIRRSVAAARDLPAGTVLSLSDLTWVRPADGLPPGQESMVLGKRLTVARTTGQRITPDMVEPLS